MIDGARHGRSAVEVGCQDGAAGHRPADAAGAVSPPRPGTLDPWRERIKQWLCEEPRLTAKRIRRLLPPMAGPVPARTVRRYVAGLRTAVRLKEAFVHRSVRPGTTMEVDFGESWVDIAGAPCKVKYLVATLPFSNAYFAKAYPVERIESLLDGIESAFRYFEELLPAYRKVAERRN